MKFGFVIIALVVVFLVGLSFGPSQNEALFTTLMIAFFILMASVYLSALDMVRAKKRSKADLEFGWTRVFRPFTDAERWDLQGTSDGEQVSIAKSGLILARSNVEETHFGFGTGLVNTADTHFGESMVRELTQDERTELGNIVDSAYEIRPLLVYSCLAMYASIRSLSNTTKYPVLWLVPVISVGVFTLISVAHYKRRRAISVLLPDLEAKMVVKDESEEYLRESRVLWSVNGVPAPWRRGSVPVAGRKSEE